MKNGNEFDNNKNLMANLKIKNADLIEAKHNEICRAAEQLFASKGYHNTSIRDIANTANISVGSLYNYINNKEDILYFLAKRVHWELREEVIKVVDSELDVIDKLKGTITTMIRVIDRFQEYVLFIYRESNVLKKEDLISVIKQESFFSDTFEDIIKKGVDQGLFETDDPVIMANMIAVMTHSWALKRYNLKRFSQFYFSEVLAEFVIKGLRKSEQA